MRCVAIIMVHNGLDYLEHCIRHLHQQEIEVALVDHGSIDGTYEYCQDYLKPELCYLERIPHTGRFSLAEQLAIKAKIVDMLSTDWVIHQDVDECLEPPAHFDTLKAFLVSADALTFNVINFNEFVFLPYIESPEQSFYDSLYYYFFQPFSPRLMRAWRKDASLANHSSGGHLLRGDVRLCSETGSLKHYIFTSQSHAYKKYQGRYFDQAELAKGWHSNRVNIPYEAMTFPSKEKLKKLTSTKDRIFDTTDPWIKHYWQLIP